MTDLSPKDEHDFRQLDALEALPSSVIVSQAFAARMPTQRVLDELARIEPAPFTELMQSQPSRVLAFRALLRDFPGRDVTSLWLASYDVEVELVETDPTDEPEPKHSRHSARTTD
jgi:hypothetical protein